MTDTIERALLIPRGTPGLENIEIPIHKLSRAEARISEVAFVTPAKAPELLTTFNKAYIEASRWVALLQKELASAELHMRRVHSMITLDRAPAFLLERGLTTARNPAGNSDLRDAVINADPEFIEATDRRDHIKAALTLIKDKRTGLEMAFSSIKKIIGEVEFLGADKTHNGMVSDDAEAGQVLDGYGRPKFKSR